MHRVVSLLAVIVCLGAFGCSEDKSPTGTVPGSIVNNLVFERPDSTVVVFGAETLLWSGDWEDGVVPVPTLHLRVGASVAGGGTTRGWSLRAVLADVAIGVPLNFPNSFIWDQPKDVDLFVLDTPNELSTAELASSGSIVFSALNGSSGNVEFTIDAVIGSELAGGSSLHVSGTFKAVSGQSLGKGGR
jgi:hypothetical protein